MMENDITTIMSFELQSKLLVAPLITPVVVPYIYSIMQPSFGEFGV